MFWNKNKKTKEDPEKKVKDFIEKEPFDDNPEKIIEKWLNDEITLEINDISKLFSKKYEASLLEPIKNFLKEQERLAYESGFKDGLKIAFESNSENISLQNAIHVIKTADPNKTLKHVQEMDIKEMPNILLMLDPYLTVKILSSLDLEKQTKVLLEIARIPNPVSIAMPSIISFLIKEINNSKNFLPGDIDGKRIVAEIIKFMNQKTEKNVLNSLRDEDETLTNEIINLMFVFEDIVLIETGMQHLLTELDKSEIALALKNASDELKEKFFSEMEKRDVELVKEEIEYMGPVRLRDVETAQQNIINIVRKLEEMGEIVIVGKGGTGEKFV